MQLSCQSVKKIPCPPLLRVTLHGLNYGQPLILPLHLFHRTGIFYIKDLFLHKMFQTYGIYILYVKDLLFYIPFLPLDIPFLLHSICSSNTFSLFKNGVYYLSLPYIKTDKQSFFRILFQCFRQTLLQVSFPLLPLNKGSFQDFYNRIRLS